MGFDWAPDGRLTYVQTDPEAEGNDTYIVDVPGGTPELFLSGEGNQGMTAFAPNGEAFAYQSTASGGAEIFVDSFPRGRSVRVSQSGVQVLWPVWSSDSARLVFWLLGTGFGYVDLDPGTFSVRDRRVLLPILGSNSRMVDRIPGTDTFLAVLVPLGAGAATVATPKEIVVVRDWIEEIKASVPPIGR